MSRFLMALVCALFLLSASATSAACPPLQMTPQVVAALKAERTPRTMSENIAIDISAFFSFCKTTPKATLCRGNSGHDLTLAEITEIDAEYRPTFEYRTDLAQYNNVDVWNNDTSCGDCEDYALTLSEKLAQSGQSGRDMGLVLWFRDKKTAHASLVVKTADAGLIEVANDMKPRPMNWKLGWRVGVIWMDGLQAVSPTPESPGMRLVNEGGSISISLSLKRFKQR